MKTPQKIYMEVYMSRAWCLMDSIFSVALYWQDVWAIHVSVKQCNAQDESRISYFWGEHCAGRIRHFLAEYEHNEGWTAALINNMHNSCKKKLWACLHGGWGPEVGEVACSGSPHLSSVDVIKLKWDIIWTGRLLHLPGVPHLHVNRP